MPVLAAHHIKKSFVERLLFEDISFEINEKDKVGLVGVNGCGKTTLFRILLGQEQPDEGTIYKNRGARVVSMAQSIENTDTSVYEATLAVFAPLMELETAMEEVNAALEHAPEKELDALVRRQHSLRERYEDGGGLTFRSRTRAALLGLGFTEAELQKPLSNMSGGERNKAQLARVLLSGANLLLLDEPTNHLDIDAIAWLEEYLRGYTGAFIVISHDRYFLDRVVRRIFAFEGGGAIRQYEGGYTDYQAACGERIAAEMEESGQEHGRGQKTGGASGAGTSDAAETAKDKNRGRQREKKLKFSYMEQKEWETIEDDIAALEEAIADLEQQMQDSARDYTALNGIIKEKEEKEALLEEKMDRWMYLNDLAEKIEAQAAAHK